MYPVIESEDCSDDASHDTSTLLWSATAKTSGASGLSATYEDSGANSIKDMGKVMGELKKNYSDNLDFAKAGSLLKELLNK